MNLRRALRRFLKQQNSSSEPSTTAPPVAVEPQFVISVPTASQEPAGDANYLIPSPMPSTDVDALERLHKAADKRARDAYLPPPKASQIPVGAVGRRPGDDMVLIAGSLAYRKDGKHLLSWLEAALTRMAHWEQLGKNEAEATFLTGGHMMLGLATALWLHKDALKPEIHAAGVSLLHRGVEDLVDAVNEGGTSWAENVNSNVCSVMANSLLTGANVLRRDYPSDLANLAWSWSRVTVNDVRELRRHQRDAFHEGAMYACYSLHAHLQSLELLKVHDTENDIDWNVNDADRAYYYQVATYLDANHSSDGQCLGFSDNHSVILNGPHHILAWIESRIGVGGAAMALREATWKADRPNPKGVVLLFDYIWSNWEGSVTHKAQTRRDTFRDTGLEVVRHKDGTRIAVKAGHPGGEFVWNLYSNKSEMMPTPGIAHTHPDAGSFSYYHKGKVIIPGNIYPKPKRTSMCNVPTFRASGSNERVYTRAEIRSFWNPNNIEQIGDMNFFGQTGEWNVWFGPAASVRKNPRVAEVGIVAGGSSRTRAEDSFTVADIAGAYPAVIPSDVDNQPTINTFYRTCYLFGSGGLLVWDVMNVTGNVDIKQHYHYPSSGHERPIFVFAEGKTGDKDSSVSVIYRGNASTIRASSDSARTEGQLVGDVYEARATQGSSVTSWDELGYVQNYTEFYYPKMSGLVQLPYLILPEGTSGEIRKIFLSSQGEPCVRVIINGERRTLKFVKDGSNCEVVDVN